MSANCSKIKVLQNANFVCFSFKAMPQGMALLFVVCIIYYLRMDIN